MAITVVGGPSATATQMPDMYTGEWQHGQILLIKPEAAPELASGEGCRSVFALMIRCFRQIYRYDADDRSVVSEEDYFMLQPDSKPVNTGSTVVMIKKSGYDETGSPFIELFVRTHRQTEYNSEEGRWGRERRDVTHRLHPGEKILAVDMGRNMYPYFSQQAFDLSLAYCDAYLAEVAVNPRLKDAMPCILSRKLTEVGITAKKHILGENARDYLEVYSDAQALPVGYCITLSTNESETNHFYLDPEAAVKLADAVLTPQEDEASSVSSYDYLMMALSALKSGTYSIVSAYQLEKTLKDYSIPFYIFYSGKD